MSDDQENTPDAPGGMDDAGGRRSLRRSRRSGSRDMLRRKRSPAPPPATEHAAPSPANEEAAPPFDEHAPEARDAEPETGAEQPRSPRRRGRRVGRGRSRRPGGMEAAPESLPEAPVPPAPRIERAPRPPRRGRPALGGHAREERYIDETGEEYEIRSLPDGTSFKVKVSEIERKKRRERRRPQDAEHGPGPAIVELAPRPLEKARHERVVTIGQFTKETARSVTFLKRRLPAPPKVAVVFGSGLSPAAEMLALSEPVPYARIPKFPKLTVAGHPGQARAGTIEGVETIFLEGRTHFYETGSMADTVYPVKTLVALGVEYLILTTSAGAINPQYRAGDIMFVRDHLNLMGDNPMFGLPPDYEPSPFTDVSELYDETVIAKSTALCRRVRVNRQVGVLAGVRGPVYETPAEVAMLARLGADAVCMSVIPEALCAAQAGIKVTALAVIVNDRAESARGPLTHGLVAERGTRFADNLKRLLRGLLGAL
ncbi:MAG: purine-nucleoside phosphorylase [Nitrospinae bacterium]|nr:purine-nucleoside phosphorylase [Nitrospinota bacterium]